MKVIHTISSIDQSTGGPARSSTVLIKKLIENENIDVIDLFTLKSDDPIITNFDSQKSHIHFCKPRFLKMSKDLESGLKRTTTDLFHGHGIWDFPVSQMAKVARRLNVPYIISIRGMLEPWSLKQSYLKKRLAMLLYQHNDLKNATCLHATAKMEAKSIRLLGYKNPIAIIPNGIDLSQYPIKDWKEQKKEKRKILFLSRIHPKKGIEYLIEAWKKLDSEIKSNWEIEIVGNGESEYIAFLNNLIKSNYLEKSIKILGPKFGPDKIETYHQSDLFVLPTFSENFGIVIAEALACGLPVITTNGTPWEDINEYCAGEWIEIGVNPLVASLKEMMQKNDLELSAMGSNGRKLIEDKYSIDSVANSFFELYSWILSNDKKPDFVI
ncbi:glycosyltransferase involved in cell wall biosynthesis [Sphingobacterium zeae]|uniref:Glycosyltransferase involved in cell wall biosynthesis n=1 Tax=Sphingobacterium zeae TaxID=1776859 RepID=A0ABU0TZL0_9SPHI|nr:glycosyltransferase [Sphingobacterium zeae]MDQ1148137.1 glycosyltransferase involved in cell wall biosynthesis [Sphingobacterium zeae]